MKKFAKALVFGLALAAGTGAAQAEDWSGLYVGAGAGGGQITDDGEHDSGRLFSGIIGYSTALSDGLIAGIEADVSDDSLSSNGAFYSVRARLGVPVSDDKGLLFASVGYLAEHVSGETADGLGLSAGYEQAITDQLSLRGEYTHGELSYAGNDFNFDAGRVALIYSF